MLSLIRVLLCALILLVPAKAFAAEERPAVDKKLIEYGWDVPTLDYIKDHIREMEAKPFDGLIFRLKQGGNVLLPTSTDPAVMTEDYENAAQVEWNRFTDNFLILYAASNQDWFNEEHWQAIIHNTCLAVKAARLSRCVGICFDPEPYGDNPWDYRKVAHRAERSFIEYQAQLRLRGAQFMRAVEKELPGAAVLFFYEFHMFEGLHCPMAESERLNRLSDHDYGLYPAFLNGMLDAASPGVTFIDGNENAYYYESSPRYLEAYHDIMQGAAYMVDPGLWKKYRMQNQVGQALYVDQYFGLRTEKVTGNFLTPDERPRWFEHNTYHALCNSDRYVWCYSERMNWWTGADIPPGAEEALRSGREKALSGAELGFDLAPIIANGHARWEEAEKAAAAQPSPTTP